MKGRHPSVPCGMRTTSQRSGSARRFVGLPAATGSSRAEPASPRVSPSGIAQCRCTPGGRGTGAPKGRGGRGSVALSGEFGALTGTTVSVGTDCSPFGPTASA
jgi:hypothetical protein